MKLMKGAKHVIFPGLRSKVLAFVAENFNHLREADAFGELGIESMDEVVACETLTIRSEVDVLQAIVGWLKANNAAEDRNSDDVSNPAALGSSIGYAENLTKRIRRTSLSANDLPEIGLLARK